MIDEGFARRLGWRPREEFRGPQSQWLPVDLFLERVNNEIPVLRERLRYQDSIIQAHQQTISQLQQRLSEAK